MQLLTSCFVCYCFSCSCFASSCHGSSSVSSLTSHNPALPAPALDALAWHAPASHALVLNERLGRGPAERRTTQISHVRPLLGVRSHVIHKNIMRNREDTQSSQ